MLSVRCSVSLGMYGSVALAVGERGPYGDQVIISMTAAAGEAHTFMSQIMCKCDFFFFFLTLLSSSVYAHAGSSLHLCFC